MNYILVADIGGTKLATALYNEEGILVSDNTVKSETEDGEMLYRSLIDSWELLCSDEGVTLSDISGISVGVPGIVDVNAGVAVYQNNLPWRNFPLANRLKANYPGSQVVVDNDVYMATWGEYVSRGFSKETFVYVTLSTGISCCTISEGRFIRGAGMAGEIGFSLIDNSAGHTLEAAVSGPSLEEKGRIAFENPDMSLKELMEFYYEGNRQATSIVGEAVSALAKEIYQVFLFVDPTCIVLGGGIFNNHPALVDAVRDELFRYLSHPLFVGKEKRIERSMHKGEAGLHGAFARCVY